MVPFFWHSPLLVPSSLSSSSPLPLLLLPFVALCTAFDLRTKMKYEENIMLHQNVNNANFIDLFVVFVCKGIKL